MRTNLRNRDDGSPAYK